MKAKKRFRARKLTMDLIDAKQLAAAQHAVVNQEPAQEEAATKELATKEAETEQAETEQAEPEQAEPEQAEPEQAETTPVVAMKEVAEQEAVTQEAAEHAAAPSAGATTPCRDPGKASWNGTSPGRDAWRCNTAVDEELARKCILVRRDASDQLNQLLRIRTLLVSLDHRLHLLLALVHD
eukprot:4784019-Pleurochrysis_carterae.AAC.5